MAPSRAVISAMRGSRASLQSHTLAMSTFRLAAPLLIPRRCYRVQTTTCLSSGLVRYVPQRINSVGLHKAYSAAAAEAGDPVVPPDFLDEKERAIFDQLKDAFDPIALEVQDVSGGCGSMYAVAITSAQFKGLTVIKQHRLVNDILKEKIKDWHGLQLRTKAP